MRKLATALAVSIALSSGSAHALSLGEIEMRSALNQPMSAEIRLSSVRAGELDGMIVKLASPEAFARAGIDRTDVLSDLEFTVSEATQSIIITSRRPVIEPFLNFLLEVDWASGRMVREYTVLLDPPVFLSPNASSRSDTAADSPAFVQRDDTSLVTPTPIQRETVIPGDIVSFDQDGGELVTLDSLSTDSIGVAAEERALATSDAARSATSSLIGGDNFDTGGELVGLDDLDPSAVDIGNVEATSTFDSGEVVTLTDLGAPNTATQTTLNSSGIPEVQLFGGGAEAGDVASSGVATSNSSAGSTAGGSVTVQRGDTLGAIAADAAGNGVSAQQMMMALLAANESAFINGNINLVKAGATLRIPDATEATRLSQAEALASVNEQSRLWQELRDSTRSGQRATQVAQGSNTDSTNNAADAGGDADLSDQAAAILERARTEVLRRDELSIVADNESTTTSASATSDESTDGAGAVSDINRRIQLAREELASSVRETTDLDEQSDALRDTGENLDTLVTLQQSDIAKLEAQLEAAKSGGDTALDGAGDALAGAGDAVGDAVGDAAGGASDLIGGAGDAVGDAAGSAGDLIGGAADGASDAANNAISAAGEQLDSVELIGTDAAGAATDTANAAADATANAAADATATAQAAAGESKGWLASVMDSPLKWIPIALIGLFGVGLLGVLFKRKKSAKFDDEELDDVEFFDDVESVDGVAAHSGVDLDDEFDGVKSAASAGVSGVSGAGAAAAAGAAGVAGTAAAAFGMGGSDDEDHQADEIMSQSDHAQSADANLEGLDHDDTISEVDVYLAYGLHGQAEELLTKAIDRDSDNPEYHEKLLETYAAQGNSESYAEAASNFQNKFGASHPSWSGIAERGNELNPGNAMFAGSAAAVASVGVGKHDEAVSMGDEDFASSLGSDDVSSINREFGGAGSLAASDEDESHLMDQSIDPAFAFDEADLEATGDFSQIADEIASDVGDDTSSLDFPSMDKAGDALDSASGAVSGAALGAAGAAAAGAAGIAGTVGDKASNAMNDMSLDMPDSLDMPNLDATSNLSGAAADLDLDATSNLSSAADDLTLDLNQLSGDMELDSTELLDDSINSVDSMNTPSSDDTLLAGTDSLESVDEMDTMMDLAKAYIDMGDNDSASSALDEIVKSGSPQQVSEAETLKRKIS